MPLRSRTLLMFVPLLLVGCNGSTPQSSSVSSVIESAETTVAATTLPPEPLPEPTQTVTSLASGTNHSCWIPTDGSVVCWGEDAHGALGTLELPNSYDAWLPPNVVKGLPLAAKSVGVGLSYSCALLLDGSVWCWGYNGEGALGTFSNEVYELTPAPVVGLPGPVSSLAVNFLNACAMTSNGEVFCWGDNSWWALGTGQSWSQIEYSNVALPVKDLPGRAIAISVGQNSGCAVLEQGQLSCWGLIPNGNDSSVLSADEDDAWTQPTNIDGLSAPATAVVVGQSHICAVLVTGNVECLGENDVGQLGDGTVTTRIKPMQVTGIPRHVRWISSLYKHTCVILDDDSTRCWGSNETAQLGSGSVGLFNSPNLVSGLVGTPKQVAAGENHTCVLTAQEQVLCWGSNEGGLIGDGTTKNRLSPTPILPPK